MKLKLIMSVAALVFIATPGLSHGDAFDLATGQDSPLVQTSSDSHIKVTLLYAGPVKDGSGTYAGILLMYEDLRTDDQRKADGLDGTDQSFRGRYGIQDEEFRVNYHRAKRVRSEERPYSDVLDDFLSRFGSVQIPKPVDPKNTTFRAIVSEDEPKDPYDLLIAIGMLNRGKATFHFRDITAASFSSH